MAVPLYEAERRLGSISLDKVLEDGVRWIRVVGVGDLPILELELGEINF